jgi:16S rRNA (adenine1518-N6/adenine1519-N6)-dimethyltransferase
MDTKRKGGSGGSRRRRLGQHFLTRHWGVQAVMEAIAPGASERFLEVGSGRGALTLPLLEAGASVVAVELDESLAASLASRIPAATPCAILRGDILRIDLPSLAGHPLLAGERFRVVGNLPYSIASPAILRLLSLGERVADWTLMVQREVGERILASPGSKLYGVLTLLCAARASCRRLLDLPPSCFSPPPAVHSTLAHFVPRSPGVLTEAEIPCFERVVKASFSGRRKMIKNSLASGLRLEPAQAESVLRWAGLRPLDRPEQIPLQGYLELVRILKGTGVLSDPKKKASLL